MSGLTLRQREVVEAIIQLTQQRGYPPTIKELAEHFKRTKACIHMHVVALRKKGAVTWEVRENRTRRLVARSEQENQV